MISVTIQLCESSWTTSTSAIGQFMQRGKIWEDTTPLSEAENSETFKRQLETSNGFYAVVRKTPRLLMAAVDHIRSIPLFYGVRGRDLYLSDDAEWVRLQVYDNVMDAAARDEFLLAGYVSGSNTLFPNVKQLQAGEYISVELDGVGDVFVMHERYYRFVHKEPLRYSENVFLRVVDLAAENSIRRLINYANGRQIIVPLSGGYDSRLIASLLKRAGYENVICYSYGVKGNVEAEYSKKIAQSLGFAWVFSEYTNKQWSLAWNSEAAEEYRNRASNHTSLPHIQDWLAVKNLIESNQIQKGAVIAPGHCCVTGFIPQEVLTENFGEKECLDNIVQTHFSERPIHSGSFLSVNDLKRKLLQHDISFDDRNQVASFIMEFNWAERQAKYITNSVRAYEQFDIDWWLPLWDMEFVNAWVEFPLRLRINRSFYKAYVSEVYRSVTPSETNKIEGGSEDKRKILYNIARKLFHALAPNKVLKYIQHSHRARHYKNHFLGFGGLVKESDLDLYIKSGYTIIGVYAILFIEGKWGRPPNLP